MGGGVNPIEWVLPPVALTHLAVDQTAKAIGTPIPPVPGSSDAKTNQALGDAEAAAQAQKDQAARNQSAAEQALAARTETPQEAVDARRRAGLSYQALGSQGKRRASQYLAGVGV